MKKKKIFATASLCCALLGATACAGHRPDVGPWGYDFALGNFKDVRPEDDAKLMSSMPFRTDFFMRSWGHSVERSIFGNNETAKLDIVLRRYEATRSGWSYAVSMDVDLKGRAKDGRIIAQTKATCSTTSRLLSNNMGDFTQQVVSEGNFNALTAEGRNATLWQQVWDACVKDLAVQFGQALVAGS